MSNPGRRSGKKLTGDKNLQATPLFLTFKYISLNYHFDFSLVLHNFGQGYIYIYIYICSIFYFKRVRLNRTILSYLFYFWSVRIFIWVVWLLDRINLGRRLMFPMYFQLQLEPSLCEQKMKWQTQWRDIQINIELTEEQMGGDFTGEKLLEIKVRNVL